jgi:hypothetical protein
LTFPRRSSIVVAALKENAMRRLILLLLFAVGACRAVAQSAAYTQRWAGEARAIQGDWTTSAKAYRGRIGERLTFAFPRHGTFGSVWGTGLFTDDSSIATAAVLEGLITPEAGGVVTIEVRPGAPSYRGSVRYGVRSGDFGPWQGSFAFVRSMDQGRPMPPPEPRRGERPLEGDWNTKANGFRGQNGARFTYYFPRHGTFGSVWGTGLYTDDSSIATAAVHEGLITPEEGGVVTIEIRPGAPAYRGSARYGVRTGNFGPWQGSFVFVDLR